MAVSLNQRRAGNDTRPAGHTKKPHHHETLERFGGVGEVLECLQREWTMRQIETEWHVALNSAEVKAPRTQR